MMHRFTIIIFSLFLSARAHAQFESQNITSLLKSISRLINDTIIPLFIAGTLAYIIYAVVTFIAAGDDSQKREERKKQIFWGVIGLFVMLSIWGLIGVIGNSFSIFGGKLVVPN